MLTQGNNDRRLPVVTEGRCVLTQGNIACSGQAFPVVTGGRCVLTQGDKAEARRYVKRLLQMGVSVGCVTATAIVLGRNVLPQLFSPDPTVIAAAATALPIVAASMVRPVSCWQESLQDGGQYDSSLWRNCR